MQNYRSDSPMSNLTGTFALTGQRSAVLKQTYVLLGLAVFAALAGGYIGGTTESVARMFSGWTGWIMAMVVLNAVPRIAIAVRHNPVLGISALVLDGFASGIVLSPLLYNASRNERGTGDPTLILAALGITGIIFLGVTAYVMTSGRTFSAPKGLMVGMFFAIMGAMLLNAFLHVGMIGIVISFAIGAFGVFSLVYSTSAVLNNDQMDETIPAALMLFAGIFNVFVATLNILLRLFGGRRN